MLHGDSGQSLLPRFSWFLFSGYYHMPNLEVTFQTLHWLMTTCVNIERMHVARKPLPLPPPMDKAWMNVDKVIDIFHFGNHVSPQCKERFSPAKLKEENPDFNTQAGEQTFVWVSRFQHILCSCQKIITYFICTVWYWEETYTAKCYKRNKKPVLPKVTHAD